MNDPKTDSAMGLRGPKALAIMLIVAAALTTVDLWSKWYFFKTIATECHHFDYYRCGDPHLHPDRIPVVDRLFGVISFDLVNSWNEGAAFGGFKGAQTFFRLVSFAAIGLLGYFSWTAAHSGVGYQVILGLVTSGVIGNFYDRLRWRGVRDFLDVYAAPDSGLGQWLVARFGTSHWPTFNVADACIVVGTILLIVKFYGDEKRDRRRQEIHDQNRPFTQRVEPGPGPEPKPRA